MITRFPGLLAAATASSVEGDANWVSLVIRETRLLLPVFHHSPARGFFLETTRRDMANDASRKPTLIAS